MKIWVIAVGEVLPIDDASARLFRTGMQVQYLEKRGHDITWFTSSFDHFNKINRTIDEPVYHWLPNAEIHFLKALGYKKNVSVKRILDHKVIDYHFSKIIETLECPDVILCSFPTIELTLTAVKYANKNKIPIVVDVRDLWPDIFVDVLPKWLKPFGRFLLIGWFSSVRYIFSNCTAVVGVSKGYLDWGLKYATRLQCEHDRVFYLAYPEKVVVNEGDVNYLLKNSGVDSNKTIVVFVGSFGQTYDLSVVISGIKKIEPEILETLQFVFCGEGENSQRWREEAAGVEQIIFTGWVNADFIGKLLSVANVGLAAYKSGAPQGIPNKIIEYMSAGLPILSSLTGETEELLEVSAVGLTYNAQDSENFTQMLKLMLYHEAMAKMSENSKALFVRLFRAESVYNEFADYLEGLVDVR